MDICAELLECFKIYTTLDDKLLKKCEEICKNYDITPEDLADQWAAYSISHGSVTISIENLCAMELKELRNQKATISYTKAITTTPTLTTSRNTNPDETTLEASIMDYYGTPKRPRKSSKRPRSPEPEISQENDNLNNSITSTPQTPAINAYTNRSDSGTVVLSYGQQNLLKRATFKCDSDIEKLSVKLWSEDNLIVDTKYMYEVMTMKAASLNDTLNYLGQTIIMKNQLEEPQNFNKSSGLMTSYGRICCDADGKLNSASVLLEGPQELSRGATIYLNLNKLSNYAIFPGQVVAVQGQNSSGNILIAQKMFSNALPNIVEPTQPVTFFESVKIVVAAGPFTIHDNLLYDPLQDLIKYISTNKPNVLILIGPLIDSSSDQIYNGTFAEPYDTFFEALINCIMKPLEGLNTQVILVPSVRDAHHHIIYPTPPFDVAKKYPNLRSVADPSMINIEGVVIGITSMDVLRHLGKEELCSSSQNGERMSRLVSHLLYQQSFYPLYPPCDDTCVDYELLEKHGLIDVVPHILIIPSNLRYFIKKIANCVVVNPERLTKGYIGGTFCRMEIFPCQQSQQVVENIVAEIVRI